MSFIFSPTSMGSGDGIYLIASQKYCHFLLYRTFTDLVKVDLQCLTLEPRATETHACNELGLLALIVRLADCLNCRESRKVSFCCHGLVRYSEELHLASFEDIEVLPAAVNEMRIASC